MGKIWEEMRRRSPREEQIEGIAGRNLMEAFQRVINCSELID
jgi:hypothetical protein